MRKRVLLAAAASLVLASACGVQIPPGSASRRPVVRDGSGAILRPSPGALQGLSLAAADFISSHDGWVVGGYGPSGGQFSPPTGGFVARTTDAGANWRVARLRGVIPTAVLFLNSQLGFAIAERLSASGQGTHSFGVQQASLVLLSQDGGRTWRTSLTASGTITQLTAAPYRGVWAAVSGPCATSGCRGEVLGSAVGGLPAPIVWRAPGPVLALDVQGQHAFALVVTPQGRGSSATVFASSDAGRAWAPLAVLPTADELTFLPPSARWEAQLRFTSPEDGWATLSAMDSCAMHGCAVSDVYRTTDGGRTWAKDTSPSVPCQFGPTLAATRGRVAVAEGVNLGACQGPEDTLFLSSGGAGFSVLQKWQELGVRALGFVPRGSLWALGQALMLENPDGAWRQVFPAPAPSGPIDFVSRALGFAGGSSINPGAVLRTTDGGRTWSLLTSLPDLAITAIDFANPRDGLLGVRSAFSEGSISEVLRTTDGGSTWSLAHRLPSGSFGPTAVREFPQGNGLFLSLSGTCFAPCAPSVGRTADGGIRWTVSPLGVMPDLLDAASILSPEHFLAAALSAAQGPGEVLSSSDGGKIWTVIARLRMRIGAVDLSFASPRRGSLLAFVYPTPPQQGGRLTLLQTRDGGRSWTRHDLPALSWGNLGIDFLDSRHGWLLADSTLWATSDGGATWTEVHPAVPGP